jgi:hypothetical protein
MAPRLQRRRMNHLPVTRTPEAAGSDTTDAVPAAAVAGTVVLLSEALLEVLEQMPDGVHAHSP